MRTTWDATFNPLVSLAYCLVSFCTAAELSGADAQAEPSWRQLPLIDGQNIDSSWSHIGWGGFVVDDGALRTECDPRGLGLLVYKKERFGNCQIRVVFKAKDAKSNAGVFVRIADGILDMVGKPGAAFDRDNQGRISESSAQQMQKSSSGEVGPWFAVHRGYEVQIMDAADPFHRTGAIYSLASSSASSTKPPDEWKTMIITLSGDQILVELDGTPVTAFNPDSADVPPAEHWYEPKRETKRPQIGYLGLQNHDPGDVVWFREISVRPLPKHSAAPEQ